MRERAIAATQALSSYDFVSESTLGTHNVRLTGRAILPDRLAFDVVSGIQRESVVRIGIARYVRIGTGAWHRGAVQAAPDGSPLAGLLDALRASGTLTVDASGRLAGTVTSSNAVRSGLLKTAAVTAPIAVVFSLDGLGRVTGFQLSTQIRSAGRNLVFRQTATYGHFNHVAVVAAP